MSNKYDIAIIGSGPAGLSAAINAKVRNKSIIVFGNNDFSNKLIKAPKINNYLGFYDISGTELKNEFQKHLDAMEISITCERVNAIYSMGEYFAIAVNDKMYESRTVIIATGVEYGKPLKGEEKFLGKGVGYCATCDAPLYRGKKVTIIGFNEEAEEEANYVSELAEKVYYIPMYRKQYELKETIEVIKEMPVEIIGDNKVSKVKLGTSEICTDGVFVLRDSISPAQLVPGMETENDHIKVNRQMKTNLPGCYAAGDCTGKPYQYMKAVGEGQVAALSAVAYIDKTNI